MVTTAYISDAVSLQQDGHRIKITIQLNSEFSRVCKSPLAEC